MRVLKYLHQVDSDDLLVGITSAAAIAIVLAAIFVSVRILH